MVKAKTKSKLLSFISVTARNPAFIVKHHNTLSGVNTNIISSGIACLFHKIFLVAIPAYRIIREQATS
jgi:hypothetical protein